MELSHSLLSGGISKLNARKVHKPPHVEKRMNSIPRRGNYWNMQFDFEQLFNQTLNIKP